MSLLAHEGEGRWHSGWEWRTLAFPLAGDSHLPHRDGPAFASRSRALDECLSDALRGIAGHLGAKAYDIRWKDDLEALRSWGRAALARERRKDTALPLHGARFIDLFSGCGGLALGLTQLGAQCQLGCEIDPEARKAFVEHISPKRMALDIRELDAEGLETDILTMGLVCTAYSKAGAGLGSMDPKLRDIYARTRAVIAQIDAKAIIIECAPQLLTARGGKDAEQLRSILMRAGYRVQQRTLCASRFGVPQSRERCFMVATRVGLDANPALGLLFPAGSEPAACVADILETQQPARIGAERIELRKEALTAPAGKLHEIGRIDGKACQGYRVYDPLGLGPTICASSGGPGRSTGAFLIGRRARPLSSREAFRMQGFPEWASPHPVESHALRHAGNAVAVPLARALAASLAAHLTLRPSQARAMAAVDSSGQAPARAGGAK